MPINLIPFSQLKEIMEQNMYHMSTVKPKKRCAKKTTNIKASIDRYNKKYTLFSKINNTKLDCDKSIVVKNITPTKN
jgi:hypothetical protein